MKHTLFSGRVSGWVTTALLLMLILVFTGCMSFMNHQTGRTLGKHGIDFTGYYNMGSVHPGQILNDDDPENREAHLLEFGVQVGAGERFDLGFRVNNFSQLLFLGKYQWLGNRKSVLASAVSLEGGIGSAYTTFLAFSWQVSLGSHTSVHITDYLAVGFSPRYYYSGYKDQSDLAELYNSRYQNHIFGYNAGIYLGRRHILSAELSQFMRFRSSGFSYGPLLSLGLRINIQRAESDRPLRE